jgi:hypothetical protein
VIKIWTGYGSEHSTRTNIIGTFKTVEEAEKVESLFKQLQEKLGGVIEFGDNRTRFDDRLMAILHELGTFMFSPQELEQFIDNYELDADAEQLHLKTDEENISAYIKLMVHHGAKLEIYSDHDYPEEAS